MNVTNFLFFTHQWYGQDLPEQTESVYSTEGGIRRRILGPQVMFSFQLRKSISKTKCNSSPNPRQSFKPISKKKKEKKKFRKAFEVEMMRPLYHCHAGNFSISTSGFWIDPSPGIWGHNYSQQRIISIYCNSLKLCCSPIDFNSATLLFITFIQVFLSNFPAEGLHVVGTVKYFLFA